MASIHAADLAGALSEVLASSGHDTHAPAEVVDIIDETLRQLRQIRERSIGESRRRLGAAMERSAALLDEFGRECGRCGDIDHEWPVAPGDRTRAR